MEKDTETNVYISPRAYGPLVDHLTSAGFHLRFRNTLKNVDPAIGDHPDLVLCDLQKELFYGDPTQLTPVYPGDIRFNAACTGRFFIHNLKHTDPKLLESAKANDMILVHVNQGYAKCNILIVDRDSIITSDAGITKAFTRAGGTVLQIDPGFIELPGYPYGFIGGASGTCFYPYSEHNPDTPRGMVCFNGDLSKHPDGDKIRSFLQKKKMEIIDVPGSPLRDIGSIIFERI